MALITGADTRHYNALLRMRVTGREAESIKRTHSLGRDDKVSVLRLPMGMAPSLTGCYVFKNASLKAQSLQQDIYRLKSKINSTRQDDLPPEEKAKRIRQFDCNMKYLDSALSAEMAASPYCGVIVVED